MKYSATCLNLLLIDALTSFLTYLQAATIFASNKLIHNVDGTVADHVTFVDNICLLLLLFVGGPTSWLMFDYAKGNDIDFISVLKQFDNFTKYRAISFQLSAN